MSSRTLLAAVVVVIGCGPAPAAVSKLHPALPGQAQPPMQFYVVKGGPDACGRGCDSWIAVEGKIDSGAAARFKKFFARVRARNLPLYFSSPGGNLEQAVAMGTLLREQPVVARVGRTLVSECGYEAQDGEVCIKLKQSGRELHGDVLTRGAFCNSGCPYLILGATTREIAADAAVAVHSAKITVSFRGHGVPSPEAVAAANLRAHERSDRLLAGYLAKMGVDAGLLALVKTVKFEDLHVLTREEIVRFGIDRREFVETPWAFEPGARVMVHKVVVHRKEDDKSFRTVQLGVFCLDSDRFELHLQRPAQSPALSLVSVAGSGASVSLFHARANVAEIELWGARVTKTFLQSLSESSQIHWTESSIAAGPHKDLVTQKLSNEGFSDALNKLISTCPVPAAPSQQHRVEARDQAAK